MSYNRQLHKGGSPSCGPRADQGPSLAPRGRRRADEERRNEDGAEQGVRTEAVRTYEWTDAVHTSGLVDLWTYVLFVVPLPRPRRRGVAATPSHKSVCI